MLSRVSVHARPGCAAAFRPAARPVAVRCRRAPRVVRAAKEDSYQKIEAPVRGSVEVPVSERQSEFDEVLKDDTLNPDKQVLGTSVGFVDAMRFQGAAPELANCRLAMLGFAFAMLGYATTGQNIFEQFKSRPQFVVSIFLTITVATLVPISRGTTRTGFAFFQPQVEVFLGRLAMIGILGLCWIPFVNGYMLY